MRYCKIVNNKVVNIIKADQSFIDSLTDIYIQDDLAQIGFELVNNILTDTTPLPTPPTLAENKTAKIKELISYMNSQEQLMKADYSGVSITSFLDKRTEALAWRVSNTAPTPYVDALNTKAGVLDTVARDAQLTAILVKVDAIAQLEAYEDVTRTAIKACTTQAELDLIVI